jgi:pimeloyl-ACP methyl ester carboxylesterase
VVRFDTTNTLGESDGAYEHATVTNYYEDLEDVISWASNQDWYQEPFVLVGHSLGGICSILYAEANPTQVLALAPLSTVVSGALSVESATMRDPDAIAQWKKTGWKEEVSTSRPGIIRRLRWSHMEDRLRYDILPNVKKLTMPTLLVVGSDDDSTPLEHQRILFEALPGKKELHVITGSGHTFRSPEHLNELAHILKNWIESSVLL